MALNKKHKKQLEVIRKKLPQLKQQLAGEKEQMDDPAAIQRIEAEIAKMEDQRRTIEAEKQTVSQHSRPDRRYRFPAQIIASRRLTNCSVRPHGSRIIAMMSPPGRSVMLPSSFAPAVDNRSMSD